jgi:NADH:ubiquinone oxidoreductase subunit 2 (subunit N)
MSQHATRSTLKHFLQGASSVLIVIAGISFFFGGRAIHEFGAVDRSLAEIVGIGLAFLCLILGVVAKHKIEDIEWQEQNDEAEKEQQTLEKNVNGPSA